MGAKRLEKLIVFAMLLALSLQRLAAASEIKQRISEKQTASFCGARLAELGVAGYTEAELSTFPTSVEQVRLSKSGVTEAFLLKRLQGISLDGSPIVHLENTREFLVPEQETSHHAIISARYRLAAGYYTLEVTGDKTAQNHRLLESLEFRFLPITTSSGSKAFLIPVDMAVTARNQATKASTTAPGLQRTFAPTTAHLPTVVTPRGTWYYPQPGRILVFPRSGEMMGSARKHEGVASHLEILRSQGRAPEAAENLDARSLLLYGLSTSSGSIEAYCGSGGKSFSLYKAAMATMSEVASGLDKLAPAGRDFAVGGALSQAADLGFLIPPHLRWMATNDPSFRKGPFDQGRPVTTVYRRFLYVKSYSADDLADYQLALRLRVTEAMHFEAAQVHLGTLAAQLLKDEKLAGGILRYDYDAETGALTSVSLDELNEGLIGPDGHKPCSRLTESDQRRLHDYFKKISPSAASMP